MQLEILQKKLFFRLTTHSVHHDILFFEISVIGGD